MVKEKTLFEWNSGDPLSSSWCFLKEDEYGFVTLQVMSYTRHEPGDVFLGSGIDTMPWDEVEKLRNALTAVLEGHTR